MYVSSEEFFMYLTIALIVMIPVSVRIHRYLMRNRATKLLRDQFTEKRESDGPKET